MAELPGPMEIYEWREDGRTEEWTILNWQEDLVEIHPKDRPAKMITVLRIHVPPEEKPEFPHYWDLTSARLVSQLLPMLAPPGLGPQKFKITAIGVAPGTHFSVSRMPL